MTATDVNAENNNILSFFV